MCVCVSLPVNTVDRLMNKILDFSRSYKDREHDALMNGGGGTPGLSERKN